MINTYENYLRHPTGNILTIEDAANIYSRMCISIMRCQLG